MLLHTYYAHFNASIICAPLLNMQVSPDSRKRKKREGLLPVIRLVVISTFIIMDDYVDLVEDNWCSLCNGSLLRYSVCPCGQLSFVVVIVVI